MRAVAGFLLAAALCCGQQIRLDKDGAVKVFDWPGARTLEPRAAAGVFSVFVADSPGALPLLGSCRVEDGVLIFQPRFPLQPGLRYRAVLAPTSTTATFEVPRRNPSPSTVLEHIYPSTDRLPENQLKFYLHFSAPMSRGEAQRRVRLLDPTGRAISLPFLELDQELWDPDGRRLTILFDPGRIKRGLLPHEEAGVPIEEGKTYTLVVDREWLDEENRPLADGLSKTFRVGPADRQPPDPKAWRLTSPRAAGRDPLSLEFPEPLDRALLERLLEVVDARGRPVPGSIQVDREETRWLFTPREPWKAGEYKLLVERTLEDLAGNTIGRPFEVDLFERVEERISRETIPLPFRVIGR